MAAVTEEKVSDLETSFGKEKLSTSTSSVPDSSEVKSDAVLDEIAAKVDALNCKEDTDDNSFVTKSEDPATTIQRQSEVIKKQAETINTLIHQLRVMFDEYNAACQEKEYYEDLSEALLRYIEICEGKVFLELDDAESQNDDENIGNLIQKDQPADDSLPIDGTTPPNPTPEKQAEGATAASGEEETPIKDEQKQTITNTELIRLNHILLKEIIELRNERDILRSNVVMSEDDGDDDSEYDTGDDEHVCQHCTPTSDNRMQHEDEEYEHKDLEHMQKIENKSEEDTE